MSSRRRVISIVGTRPEAIKMAPVIRELARRAEAFDQVVVTTGQHREMLDQVLAAFEIEPDIDLSLMEEDQRLGDLASRALAALTDLFAEERPDVVLVQGDTTTVASASLAAFYLGVPTGHVEAGLRSFDLQNPFPEELNRRIAGLSATFHFAPTSRARQNLLDERVPSESIFVTGNTIVDALETISLDEGIDEKLFGSLNVNGGRVLLVTAHRRENHGGRMRSICTALRTITERYDDVEIVFPVHLNPNVRSLIGEELGGIDRIHLVDPLGYDDLLRVMRRSYFILTDSGGIQEEAASFRKPVLVLRHVTERPEVVEAGFGKVVGTGAERITKEASLLLEHEDEYDRMTTGENPFGDGRAAERIATILEERLQR